MKRTLTAVLFLTLIATPLFGEDKQPLTSKRDVDNYATGVGIVRTLKQQGGEFDLNLVIRGMMDELTGEKLLLSDAELRRVLAALKAESGQKKSAYADAGHTISAASADTESLNAVPLEQNNPGVQQEPSNPSTDAIVPVGLLANQALPLTGPPVTPASASSVSTQNQQTGHQGSTTATATAAAPSSPATNTAVSSSGTNNLQYSSSTSDVQPVQISQLTPDGRVMSKRNQAKLTIESLKAEMRSSIASGELH